MAVNPNQQGSRAKDKLEHEACFPLAGQSRDGFSTETSASATCYCGQVQLEFPTERPGFVDTFVCHCHDCKKFIASVLTTAFIVQDSRLKHVRGEDNLTRYAQSLTIASGNEMTNFFCKTCGTLMYRRGAGFPGNSILRCGTVDDVGLLATKLKPRVEQFARDRVPWLREIEGVSQCLRQKYVSRKPKI
ncbi:hypothetical protein ACM66B_006355 [Microbotryomycetes sp. NB124-2]